MTRFPFRIRTSSSSATVVVSPSIIYQNYVLGFRFRCGLIPWLAIVMIEIIVIGIPLIVFFGLISLYLAAQVTLAFRACEPTVAVIIGCPIVEALSLANSHMISSWPI